MNAQRAETASLGLAPEAFGANRKSVHQNGSGRFYLKSAPNQPPERWSWTQRCVTDIRKIAVFSITTRVQELLCSQLDVASIDKSQLIGLAAANTVSGIESLCQVFRKCRGLVVNQICCSITRELKATEQGGGFYLQRSTCSIELSYETESDIAVTIRWHTGARLLGNGQKDWRANGLEDALRRFEEYAPGVNVPYHACVAELLAHVPSSASAGKIVTFHQFVPSEGSSQQDTPQVKQAPS